MKNRFFFGLFMLFSGWASHGQWYMEAAYRHAFQRDAHYRNAPGFYVAVSHMKNRQGFGVAYFRQYGFTKHYPMPQIDSLTSFNYLKKRQFQRRSWEIFYRRFYKIKEKFPLLLSFGLTYNRTGIAFLDMRYYVSSGEERPTRTFRAFPVPFYSRLGVDFRAGYSIPLDDRFSFFVFSGLELFGMPDLSSGIQGCEVHYNIILESAFTAGAGIRINLPELFRHREHTRKGKRTKPFWR